MKLPTIRGLIDRRILANYRLDPEVVARLLPAPFKPKLAGGFAIAGICLIRLKHVRPAFIPINHGITSENAAHRFAVEWDDHGQRKEGVFIPRRDSNSRLNTVVGGRLFPGIHHHAHFEVEETNDRLHVDLLSDDEEVRVNITARVAAQLPATSAFRSLEDASRFFEGGSLGYSATRLANRFDGLELRCTRWSVQPMSVEEIHSSYFDDRTRFPAGSLEFDCALLMRDIEHEWHARQHLCCGETAGTLPAT